MLIKEVVVLTATALNTVFWFLGPYQPDRSMWSSCIITDSFIFSKVHPTCLGTYYSILRSFSLKSYCSISVMELNFWVMTIINLPSFWVMTIINLPSWVMTVINLLYRSVTWWGSGMAFGRKFGMWLLLHVTWVRSSGTCIINNDRTIQLSLGRKSCLISHLSGM